MNSEHSKPDNAQVIDFFAPESSRPAAQPSEPPEAFQTTMSSPMQFLKRRTAIISHIRDHLVEATYKNGGYIDRENDYYKVPNSNGYAFTRSGAGKLADRFAVKQMDEQTDAHTYERDHVMYRIRVSVGLEHLLLGIAAGSCSTSEKRFTSPGIKKVYGAVYSKNKEEVTPPDYRAADHDVLTMAKKRAYVNAIVDALAAHDVLEAAIAGPTADQLKRALLLLSHESITDEERTKFTVWIAKPNRTADQAEEQLVALEDRIHATAEDGK